MKYSIEAQQHELEMQRTRFAEIASSYDKTHSRMDEHGFATAWLCANCDFFGFQSLLEVGAGTARFYSELAQRCPWMRYTGIEPVKELREEGYARGIPRDQLLDGNGYKLSFPDRSVDIVAEFAMLHHVKKPELVVAEMLRVAKRAVFISDNNCFGLGSPSRRLFKHATRILGLSGIARYLQTGGRGYLDFGDGISYAYSVFDSLPTIRESCPDIYVLNTDPLRSGQSALWAAPHAALLGVRDAAAGLAAK